MRPQGFTKSLGDVSSLLHLLKERIHLRPSLETLPYANDFIKTNGGFFPVPTELGPVVPHIIEKIVNTDFSTGATLGVFFVLSYVGIITGIILIGLAYLVIRARPDVAQNRFMAVLLLAEAYRVLAMWYTMYSFEGSRTMLRFVEFYRAGWFVCTFICLSMYVAIAAFHPTKRFGFLRRPVIKEHLWWAIPVVCTGLMLALVSTNGMADTLGPVYHIDCSDGSNGQEAVVMSLHGEAPTIHCITDDEFGGYRSYVPSTSNLGSLFLVLPVISALVGMVMMRRVWKNLESQDEGTHDAVEARSLYIGFAGKVFLKGLMIFSIVGMTVVYGDFDLSVNVAEEYGQDVMLTYSLLVTGFIMSILFTGILEGVMFTYAMLKNEILGIDEKLRSGFSAALFAAAGGLALLFTTELIEGVVGGGGIVGGVIVGVPLIVLRKPIYALILKFSSILMPESFTKFEKSYLEAFRIVMEDGVVSERESELLRLQAKTLGLNEDRVRYIESWYLEQSS